MFTPIRKLIFWLKEPQISLEMWDYCLVVIAQGVLGVEQAVPQSLAGHGLIYRGFMLA